MRAPGLVVLADGTVFRGLSVGAEGVATGEVVFTTSMTGTSSGAFLEVLSFGAESGRRMGDRSRTGRPQHIVRPSTSRAQCHGPRQARSTAS